jgi:hemerythrin superfamily protein
MLIYESLVKDHLKIQSLIRELIEVGEGGEVRRGKLLIEEIRDELIPHARAEEAIFYNVIGAVEQGNAQPLVLHHGYQEHIEAETVLRALQAKDTIDPEWKMLARKFQKAVEEHIKEEEGEIFQTARELISDLDAEMMAKAFEELKPQVQKEGWMKNTLDLVVNLMPPKYAATLRTMALRPEQTIRIATHH